MSAIPHWGHFDHEADMGIRGFGTSPAAAFEQAALAMTAIVTDVAQIEASECVEIDCNAPDLEMLLVDWLNAVIYEMATRKLLFGKAIVQIDDSHLHATVWGERIDVAKHKPAVEVKGATYTALRVAKENDEWIAQAVVDV